MLTTVHVVTFPTKEAGVIGSLAPCIVGAGPDVRDRGGSVTA